ncbi:hypothetical protein LEN26_011868 [Aphanomyces euteiches]|nr:hypothetical protein AeMF1_015328 [Aphanomyces euteiches]KAH9118940.1 hypothetical protein LEN26_011868 [Aphanomyces euteiches]KAH9189853.1 hypothetical protein AeNC1_008179 [Aphanomyces euteiches]
MNLSKSNWNCPRGANGHVPMSLRYMNEFVGKLQCAPQLLQLQIFPDAKEVSESMGLFNAARRFLPLDDATQGIDGIVVVGDGSTPRTAVMFAYRTRGWTCFSVDPEMRVSSENETVPWEGIERVVPIRAKIEDIQIHLRRAIVVLVHAHVTLEQALSAVHAESIVGVLTVPCCNWYGQQEELFERHPDLVYDDFSILSDHREIRVWAGEDPHTVSVPVDAMNQSTKASTGCVVKTYSSPQETIDAKELALNELHTTTITRMAAGSAATPDLWSQVVNLLLPFLSKDANHRVGLLGDGDHAFRTLLGCGETFHVGESYDVVVDIGMLHECLYSIETRQALPLILKLCRTVKAALSPNGLFVCVTPRRKLKGTSYFANPRLQWTIESKSLGSTFVLFCRTAAQAVDEPPFDAVLADLRQAATNVQMTASTATVSGEIAGIRIKSRKLVFLDVETTSERMQVVLNFQTMEQGQYSYPDQVARHLRIGDTVTAHGDLETSTKLNARVLDIVSRRPIPAKPRYGIQ